MKKLEKIGLQLWTVRDFMKTEADICETFKKIKTAGFDYVQTAGCACSYEKFGQMAADAGIEIIGTHDNFDLMVNDFEKAMENHKALGTVNMGVGGHEVNEEFIRQANEIGEKLKKYGGNFSYHNHSGEFIRREDGKSTMEVLMEGLNPETTSFCLDTFWVQNAGGDVREWINKLSGRIDILHLKDMMFTKDNERKDTEIGNGNLYWEGIIEEAQKAGVRYYIVEQEDCEGDIFESIKMSSDYLHKNFM